MLAPAIVHQIWMQGWDQRPPKFEDNIQQLRALNPEFQFRTWDEEQMVAECERLGPEFAAKYRSFQHMISRVDYGRYVLLYLYGGISLDLDMKPLHPLRQTPGLDEHDFIVSGAAYPMGTLGLLNNAVLIVTPRHPLLLEFIQRITERERREEDCLNRDMYIQVTTGPMVFSEFVREHPQSIHVLPHAFYEPCMSLDPYCKVPETAIMDHQHELSWMTAFGKWLTHIAFVLLYNWRTVLFVILVFAFSVIAWKSGICLKISGMK
jgi:mannosyltransferase OCH1-like enzyme